MASALTEIERLHAALEHEKRLREGAEDSCKVAQAQRDEMHQAISIAVNSGPDEWYPYTPEQGRDALLRALDETPNAKLEAANAGDGQGTALAPNIATAKEIDRLQARNNDQFSTLLDLANERDKLRNALRFVMACAGDIDNATSVELEAALTCGDPETERQANAWLVARAALPGLNVNLEAANAGDGATSIRKRKCR